MRQFALEVMLDKTQKMEHRMECLQVLRQLEGYAGRQPKLIHPAKPAVTPEGKEAVAKPQRFDIRELLASLPDTETEPQT
jgi:hypothetical protein